MPITFACPRCARRLTIATRKAGAEVGCPGCKQRVIVPQPPENKPLPGILVEHVDGGPTAQSLETDTPSLVHDDEADRHEEPRPSHEPDRRDDDRPYREPDDDYDPLPIRRRRKKSLVTPVVLIGVGLLAVVALVIVILAYNRNERIAKNNPKAAESTRVRDRQPRTEPNRQVPQEEFRSAPQAEYDEHNDNPARTLLGVVSLLVAIPFYFLPSIVAVVRRHNNIAPILVVNFFLGWLCVGWVISLSWAFTDLKHLENRRRSYL